MIKYAMASTTPDLSQTQDTDASERLSLKTKLAFGAGDIAGGITATIRSFSLLVFLTEVAGLGAGLAGGVVLIGRVWDAVNDPLVGYLSDRTHSRWGRRHIWMLWGSVPLGVTFALIWIVPPFEQTWALFAYYVVMSLLFDTAYTAVNLPYMSLTPELTRDYDERTRLNSVRFAFSIGGSILALVLGFVIASVFSGAGEQTTQYLVLGVICAVLSVLPIYWCVWGTEERYDGEPQERLPALQEWTTIFSNRPFLLVVGVYLCSWLAFQLTAGVIPYYVTVWMNQDQYFLVALVVQAVAFSMLFVWSRLSDRIGKRAIYGLGIGLWLIAQVGLFFLPRDLVWLMYALSVLAGCGVSVVYLVPWSLLPDVIELDELRTGRRREGMFYSLMSLLQKVGVGIALFLVGQFLSWSGFVERAAEQPGVIQPDSALLAIRTLAGPLPGVILLIGIVLTYYYPISRAVHDKIRRQLQRRLRRQSRQRAKADLTNAKAYD